MLTLKTLMKKRILIAPLNWGLGHATRCIPVINSLIAFGFEPLIASDGNALELLKKEFPRLALLTLPSYNISYPTKGSFKWHFAKSIPRIIRIKNEEHKLVESIIESHQIDGIISDNRFGVFSKKVPSVYLTHQPNVLSGNTSFLSTKWHLNIIAQYNECWIPDNNNRALTGILGNSTKVKIKTKYIGPLSRFKITNGEEKFDLMILLSGPEPQRTLLEEKLLSQLKKYSKKVLLVRGVVESKQTISVNENCTIYNYMLANELNKALNSSALVLARSGYSTIMDLAKLKKKAFFIPTPGQYEQEFLARHLEVTKTAPYTHQKDFKLSDLNLVENYSGFTNIKFTELNKDLFSLF